ncbi:otoconin-90 isoform X3 [Protopterus annectens]|uniref:otoconin-90 isoform X3 n=1 Tax=Protopterus annectens TaxID=7888 RepID=UPI001CFC38E9|nr:otoconin-90 isoform X3 [Protopterus annectens]
MSIARQGLLTTPRIKPWGCPLGNPNTIALMLTPPPVAFNMLKTNACLMELCRFFQQCLCISERRVSTKGTKRYCANYRIWYVTHRKSICKRMTRIHHVHNAEPQESDSSARRPANFPPVNSNHNENFGATFESQQSILSFLECLGSHFIWLQSVYNNFPSLFNFVIKLRCVTGLCPKDFEDYGCACRFEMEGLPIDEPDRCCFQHRKCYEEIKEMGCTLDPEEISFNGDCLSKNITCASPEEVTDTALTALPNERLRKDMKEPVTAETPFHHPGVTTAKLRIAAAAEVCERSTFQILKENGQLKHELPHLGEMLFCLAGQCSQKFERYGCFCGWEGKGQPLDQLDRCCFLHQCCIDQIKRLGCRLSQSSSTHVTCMENKPACFGGTTCDRFLCSCAKAAAECMAEAPFNRTLKLTNRHQCRGEKASCERDQHVRLSSKTAGGSATDGSREEDSSEEEDRDDTPRRDVRHRSSFYLGIWRSETAP